MFSYLICVIKQGLISSLSYHQEMQMSVFVEWNWMATLVRAEPEPQQYYLIWWLKFKWLILRVYSLIQILTHVLTESTTEWPLC